MTRLRRWWREATPGEIAQLATATLALLAAVAATLTAFLAYRLSQRTEERLSSATIEVTASHSAFVQPEFESDPSGGGSFSAYVFASTFTVRNIGGVGAVVSSVELYMPEDPDCLPSPGEPLSDPFLSSGPNWEPDKPTVPFVVNAGTAKDVDVSQHFSTAGLVQNCAYSSNDLYELSDETDLLGVVVEFSNGETIKVPPGKTDRVGV